VASLIVHLKQWCVWVGVRGGSLLLSGILESPRRSTPGTRCALCFSFAAVLTSPGERVLPSPQLRRSGFRTTSPFHPPGGRLCWPMQCASRSPGQTPASLTANRFAVRSSLARLGRQHQVRFRSSSFGHENRLEAGRSGGLPVARDWLCLSKVRAARALTGT